MNTKLTIQSDVFYIIAITALLIGCLFYVNRKMKATDPLEKPKGIVHFALIIVEMVDGMVKDTVNEKHVHTLAPYIAAIGMYIFISNIIGLFGFESTTMNYSVTLTLALITWIVVQVTAIKASGFKGYLHGFIEPYPPFLIMNFFGKLAPLLSMSLRLFGNILSGSIIMSLVYTFTGWLSTSLLGIFLPITQGINFLAPIVTPVLHAYFDVFAGFIQMFIFITLTMVFIGNELPQEE